jgi:hypothetical protein
MHFHFLFRLIFFSSSCASSELPKVKSTCKSPSFLWISVVPWMILFRCSASTFVLMRSLYSYFDVMRLFLFQCSSFTRLTVVDDVVLCTGRLVDSRSHAQSFWSMQFLVDASQSYLRYSLNYYACIWMFLTPVIWWWGKLLAWLCPWCRLLSLL